MSADICTPFFSSKVLDATLIDPPICSMSFLTKNKTKNKTQDSRLKTNTIHICRYFAILHDRAYGGPCVVCSLQGGMSIEDVAEETPEAIIVEPVDITIGLTDAQSTLLASKLGNPTPNPSSN
jgi:succinyl-CoA synthetase beta subunit